MSLAAVFDTNILFSGLGWRGRPFECLDLARSGEIESVTCPEILAELAELLIGKLGMTDDETGQAVRFAVNQPARAPQAKGLLAQADGRVDPVNQPGIRKGAPRQHAKGDLGVLGVERLAEESTFSHYVDDRAVRSVHGFDV